MITIPKEDNYKANLILSVMRSNWPDGEEADFMTEHVDRLERALAQQTERADRLHNKLKELGGIAQLDTMGLFRNDVELQKIKDILEPFMPIR